MNDRELLELAAKAVKLEVHEIRDTFLWVKIPSGVEANRYQIAVWSPLTYDGDALRLAVKLGMTVESRIENGSHGIYIYHDQLNTFYADQLLRVDDGMSLVRHAIVRAAAEIGKAL